MLYFLHRRITNVDDKRLIQAYYASKQFVQEESEQAGLIEYSTLRWSEFLEFVCRLAFFKYRGTQNEFTKPLIEKISIVLSEIFALEGLSRIDPP